MGKEKERKGEKRGRREEAKGGGEEIGQEKLRQEPF